ncbi:MAG TPA: hypothetical protein VGV68_00310 [Terriglobia bacterium]|nr:hypothetical protein [Terriglobia bacterium]
MINQPHTDVKADAPTRWLRFDIIVVLLATSTSLAAPQRATPDVSNNNLGFESKLDAQLKSFDSGGRTLVQAVIDLAYEYRLPLGLEYVDQEAVRRPLNIKLRGSSVRKTILTLTNEVPEYSASFSGGVVHIYSPRARSNPANILNIIIHHFVVTDADPQEASTKLLEALVHAAGVRKGIVESTAIGSPIKVSVHMENAKVYEILDAIVGQQPTLMWTVTAPPGKLSVVQGDLWYVYPLDPPVWKSIVIDRLRRLFPGPMK